MEDVGARERRVSVWMRAEVEEDVWAEPNRGCNIVVYLLIEEN